MDDVTEDVQDAADITVNIDTRDETRIPPDLLELGLAVQQVHENTGVRVDNIEMDTQGGHPPRFRLEGAVLTDY